MKTHRYTVLLERENGGYRAHCPALPRCRSYGDTKKEAIRNIKISICYRLETLIAKGKPIPKDGDRALRSESRSGV
jgi:predicted RNase H-like HicB family nuclease